MKKKTVAIIVLAAILLAGVAGYGIWQYMLPRFHDVSVELGASNVPIDHFMTIFGKRDRAALVTDLATVDWTKPGSTPIVLRHGIKEETVNLTVRDTIAPKVTFVESLTKDLSYKIKPEDFVEKAEDLSDITIAFEEPITDTDYEDRKLTVAVTDASGNSTKKECMLFISWIHREVTLELGQELTKAHILMNYNKDKDLLDQTQLDAVNAAGVGKYEVSSTVNGVTRVCEVTVVDTIGPEVTVKPVTVYQGEEVRVEDLVEKAEDLSGEVELRLNKPVDTGKAGEQTVVVEAVDPHGNVTQTEAKVEVLADTEGPVIKFNGDLTVDKNQQPDYLKGVSANDSRDGVCEVTFDSSAVDLTKAGTYKVVYKAKDSAGNVVQKKRNVVVNPDRNDTAALVAEIAATLSDDVQEIRNYVREIEYTHNWGGEDPAWFGFTKGHGNCYVHALCLQELLEYKGYETQLIWVKGSKPGSEEAANGWSPHYWLIVKLDGQWKHLDATPGPTHTKYDEPMNDTQRLDCLKGRTWDFDKWPACP